MKHSLKVTMSSFAAVTMLFSSVFSNTIIADTINTETSVYDDLNQYSLSDKNDSEQPAYGNSLEQSTDVNENNIALHADDAKEESIGNFSFWLEDYANDDGNIPAGDYEASGNTIHLVKGIAAANYDGSYYMPSWGGFKRGDRENLKAYSANKKRPNDCNGFLTLPEEGSSVIFTPTEDGVLTVYCYTTSFIRVTPFVKDESEKWVNKSNTTAEDGTVSVGHSEDIDSPTGAEQFSFEAKAGEKYVISTTGRTNNCGFIGFKYVLNELVDVKITFAGAALDSSKIDIIDTELGTTAVSVSENGTIKLNKNHIYEIKSSNAAKKALLTDENGGTKFTCDGSDLVFHIIDVPDVTLTGKITADDSNFNVSDIESIKFTSMEDPSNFYEYTAAEAIKDDNNYTVSIKPGEFNTSVTTKSGRFVTKDRVSVSAEGTTTNEIYLESIFDGTTYYLPKEVNADNLTFDVPEGGTLAKNNDTSIKASQGVTITVPVSGVKKVTVAGWYAGTWDINGQNSVTADSSSNAQNPVTNSYTTDGTETSVTVNITGEGTNYLYWIKVVDDTFVSEINVPSADYPDLKTAVNAIRNMNRPKGEAGRVTINLTADIFEQIVIDTPYVTINGNNHEIAWYYGVGSMYYSVDDNGYYSESLFRDKYSKREGDGSLWGGTVIVTGNNFIAHDVTFRNTYNYEVTDKELEDGQEGIGNIPTRDKNTDPEMFKAKERSNAFYIGADNIEVYDSKILSSQDTLGRNGSDNFNYHTYFNNCIIGGNVDYICGEFTAVFDDCELQWKTYSDTENNEKAGYIVAPKTSPYIFRNCKVTTDGKEGELTVLGQWGRTWGANSCTYLINTETNGYIDKTNGWGEMSSGEGASSKFFEYNSTEHGIALTPTGFGQALTDETIIANLKSDKIIAKYLNGWTPVSYKQSVYGDVDENYGITVNDASCLLNKVLNINFKMPIEEKIYDYIEYADVDCDNILTAQDASIIMKKALESGFIMPVENK